MGSGNHQCLQSFTSVSLSSDHSHLCRSCHRATRKGQPGAGKSLLLSSSLGSGGTSTSYNEGKLSQALDQSLPDTRAFEIWVKNKASC